MNPAYIPPPVTVRFADLKARIETYKHRQAVTDYHGGFDRETGQYWSPHQYREVVTLARSA